MADFDTDIAIIGSGFGGSVSALRLAERGWRVAVLEQGRQLSDAAGTDATRLAWMPALGLKGFCAQDVFRHVAIVSGIGVGGGYLVHQVRPWDRRGRHAPLRARKVILAAGALGTQEVLFASHDRYRTLPGLPRALGEHVRTNSEAIVSILANDEAVDVTRGATISTHFYPDAKTHITQNRFPQSYGFMKWYMGPLVDGERPLPRALRTLLALLLKPLASTRSFRARHCYKRISVLTVMQQADNEIAFCYGRTLLRGFRHGLISRISKGGLALLHSAGQCGGARLCRGQRRHAAEHPDGERGQPVGDGAYPGRRGDGGAARGRRHRRDPRGLRPPRAVCGGWQRHPGQCRRESLAHHHGAGGALRGTLPGARPGPCRGRQATAPPATMAARRQQRREEPWFATPHARHPRHPPHPWSPAGARQVTAGAGR